MMLFDDLRDNEWALVEALFLCGTCTQRTPRPSARGSACCGQRRPVGAVDG